jgi:hypothetical protein
VITEIVFAADPLLTDPRRREAEEVGFAICSPERGQDGTLAAVVDFRLR